MKRRILLSGGGTGGHVYPLLAVLRALEYQADLTALWLGSERIESQILPKAGVEFEQIDIRFSWRRPTPANWGYYRKHIFPILLGRPFRQALAVLERFKPQLVIAAGGYVSAPAIWAAGRLGIPVALLQIDNPPGLVNWFFAPESARVYCANDDIAAGFEGRCSPAKLRVLGYPALAPRRSRTEVLAEYGIEAGRKLMLVMGGSLGAGAVHRLLAELLQCAAESDDSRWSRLAVLNVGGERPELMRRHLDSSDVSAPSLVQYVSVGYLEDATGALGAADFYFGRSGAATIGELLAAGLPSLLLPDPQHGDRQQFGNAAVLVQNGQGVILQQGNATGKQVLDWLTHVWDAPRLTPPSPPAAESIAVDLLHLLEEAR